MPRGTFVDKVGRRFGRLLILQRAENHRNGSVRWLCRCDCGKEVLVQSSNLMESHFTKSCGCIFKDVNRKVARTHGLSHTPEYAMLYRARHRAKRKGLAFAIQAKDIFIPEFCPVLGVAMSKGASMPHDYSPSIDRLDSSLGYVAGNIRVISHRANFLKNNASAEELELIAAWMKSEASRGR